MVDKTGRVTFDVGVETMRVFGKGENIRDRAY